jgi:hypothetical protein
LKIWNDLNASTAQSSDRPVYHIVRFDGSIYQVGLFPTIATAGNTITVEYTKRIKKVSTADYTTGTVSATNGNKTITGAGTTFTAAMVGRWIQLTDDKNWYRIAAFTSTTSITLEQTFQGTTATGAAYTIGEASELPEDYQEIPVYLAISDWFIKERKYDLAKVYREDAYEGIIEMEKYFTEDEDPVLEDPYDRLINPNLYITQ